MLIRLSVALVNMFDADRQALPLIVLRCRQSIGAGMLNESHPSSSFVDKHRATPVSYTHLTLPTICSV